jgi:hypothetical protein
VSAVTVETPTPQRIGWRDTLRGGCDVAVIGFGMLLAALPVVTVGAALSAGSAAMHHWCTYRELPRARVAAGWYLRGLLPGLAATGCAAVLAGLLALDLRAVHSGAVPGGTVLLLATTLLAALAVGIAGLVLVHLGTTGGRHWRRATRSALTAATHRPTAVPALAGIVLLAALLATVLPATVPLAAACGLFAMHVVTRRLGVLPQG